uniref:TSA: Wollemia nobilis Ref_Wollemi_Transcript_18878_1156 transcribed RNA sequence n=1 Tax=Wollemia nobilis TaxID=56998 RepID=A0A0C9S2M4_9CONI
MVESRYEISQTAYVKLVLHALKHKASAVNGILVGKLSASHGTNNDNKTETVEIMDAVPLSHGHLGLLPTMEIAIIQAEEYFASKGDGLSIVGYYHANERYDDLELNSLAKKIGDHISRYFPQAPILLLDNNLLEELPKGGTKKPVVQLYTRDASKVWRQAGSSGNIGLQLVFKEPAANTILWDYVSEGKEELLVDFDEHLDDISKDWLNSNLFD